MTIRIEKNGAVTTVIHSRKEARNAVSPAIAEELAQAFLAFEADPEARVGVFYGEGGAFCAGFDLKEASQPESFEKLTDLSIPSNWNGGKGDDIPSAPMGPSRLTLSKPVIAAISGPAVAGGMELALWCDMRVMEKSAYMGVYCRRWGVPLIDGGTVRLPRLIGMGKAMDLVLTGRKIEADEAYMIGLCERIVEDGSVREAAEAIALEISRFPQNCMLADRASALESWGQPLHEGLKREWQSVQIFKAEGAAGAGRFAAGKGRSGDFSEI